MAAYTAKCQKASKQLEQAFPEGFTTDQVDAINAALRSCMALRNHAAMDNGLRLLFPKAKFSTKRVEREYDGKVFNIMYCVESIMNHPE